MKRLHSISLIILVVTILIQSYSRFINELPDTVVRINGGIMLVAIFLAVFSLVRDRKEKE